MSDKTKDNAEELELILDFDDDEFLDTGEASPDARGDRDGSPRLEIEDEVESVKGSDSAVKESSVGDDSLENAKGKKAKPSKSQEGKKKIKTPVKVFGFILIGSLVAAVGLVTYLELSTDAQVGPQTSNSSNTSRRESMPQTQVKVPVQATGSNASPFAPEAQRQAMPDEPAPVQRVAQLQSTNLSEPSDSDLRSEIEQIKLALVDVIQQQNSGPSMQGLENAFSELANAVEGMEQKVEQLEKVKPTTTSGNSKPVDTNHIITVVKADVLDSIRTYINSSSVQQRRNLISYVDKKIAEASTVAVAPQPVITPVASEKVSNPQVQPRILASSNHQQAKPLIFGMSTEGVMIVTVGGDNTNTPMTLRVGETIIGRGKIERITARGCISFTDGTNYEPVNREGACTGV